MPIRPSVAQSYNFLFYYSGRRGKAVLQLPEQKNRRKSFKIVWPNIEI
jgi:hypothetical protein